MEHTDKCSICGATKTWVVVKEGCRGGGGLSPIAAQYDYNHRPPNDCLRTINEKLDTLLSKFKESE